jgi:two-component system, OmpR family, response regulator
MTRLAERAPRVLVVDADPALLGLLEEWLSGQGLTVVADADEAGQNGFDLAVVDVPFPRHGGLCQLKRVAERHPGVPILALSSNFFAGIANTGMVARALGVAGALPKPVSREALIDAVGKLVGAGR